MIQIFKSELFWAAFSGIIAFAALLWTPLGNLIPYFRRRHLQRTLNNERNFYKQQVIRNKPDDDMVSYLSTVKNALQTIGGLSNEKQVEIKIKLRSLIEELRATHKTLVESIMPFTSDDANWFLKEFDIINQKLEALWKTDGKYRHEVRTHCGDVERLANDIVQILNTRTNEVPPNQIQELYQISWSMTSADVEIIVPIMNNILNKIKVELSLIASAISTGSKLRAIRLKEKYRFETDNLFQQLSEALDKMNELEMKL